MPVLARISVGATAAILAAALACDDDGTPPNPQGPPPDETDTTAPQTVSDLSLAYRPATRDVAFTWTAPRDDDQSDRVAVYDFRYSYSFPLDWDRSVVIADPPAPEPEGAAQEYALAGVPRGRDLFAAGRTYDAAGNASAIGPVTHLRIPGVSFEALCEDVYTRSGVEGLDVLLTAGTSWNLSTGADGRVVLDEIASGTLGIRIETGPSSPPYHRFELTRPLADDLSMSIPMIPFMPADSPLYASTLAIVLDALVVSGPLDILKRWHTYPIPWYAPDFVNVHGLDYTALTRQAAAQWNSRTGIEIFTEVAAAPASGIVLEFLPRSVMGVQNGFTVHRDDPEGYPAGETIKILDEFSDGAKLYTILMHELGHTIRLDHLPAGFIMYAGQPLPPDITDDEARVVQMMLAIPNGTNLDNYSPSSPLP